MSESTKVNPACIHTYVYKHACILKAYVYIYGNEL